MLNKQINDEEDEPAPPVGFPRSRKGSSDLQLVARRVSRKLEESNIKGAVRLATSEDILAEENDSTISALRSKHPSLALNHHPTQTHPTCLLYTSDAADE